MLLNLKRRDANFQKTIPYLIKIALKSQSSLANRSVATREYRKVYTIFPEGEKTENCYFNILRGMGENINIIVKKGDKKTESEGWNLVEAAKMSFFKKLLHRN